MCSQRNKVAIVCCYNNEEILKSMLEESIDKQDYVEIEKLFFNRFVSAAEAYKYAISHSDADYFIFIHQDIKFLTKTAITQIIEYIRLNPYAIYGLCGARREGKKHIVYSNVYHGLQNRIVGNKIEEALQVEGLDEIFLACHRAVFNTIMFDEKTFNGWHLYVEDLCLQAKENDIPIIILPILAQHKNSLEMPKYMHIYNIYPNEFYRYLSLLFLKHRHSVDAIVCPCIAVSTKMYAFRIKLYKAKIMTIIKRTLREWSLKN